jgi:hypothetical protein
MSILRMLITMLSGLNNENDSDVTLSYLVLVLLLVLGIGILGMVLVNQKVIRVFEFKNNPLTAEAFRPNHLTCGV